MVSLRHRCSSAAGSSGATYPNPTSAQSSGGSGKTGPGVAISGGFPSVSGRTSATGPTALHDGYPGDQNPLPVQVIVWLSSNSKPSAQTTVTVAPKGKRPFNTLPKTSIVLKFGLASGYVHVHPSSTVVSSSLHKTGDGLDELLLLELDELLELEELDEPPLVVLVVPPSSLSSSVTKVVVTTAVLCCLWHWLLQLSLSTLFLSSHCSPLEPCT